MRTYPEVKVGQVYLAKDKRRQAAPITVAEILGDAVYQHGYSTHPLERGIAIKRIQTRYTLVSGAW